MVISLIAVASAVIGYNVCRCCLVPADHAVCMYVGIHTSISYKIRFERGDSRCSRIEGRSSGIMSDF